MKIRGIFAGWLVVALLFGMAYAGPTCPATGALKQAQINTAERDGSVWTGMATSTLVSANRNWYVGVNGVQGNSEEEAIQNSKTALSHAGTLVYDDTVTDSGLTLHTCGYATDQSGVYVIAATPDLS